MTIYRKKDLEQEIVEQDLFVVDQRQTVVEISNPTSRPVSNLDKIPDPKKHQIISFIKSGIRIVSCFFGIVGLYELGFFGLLIAEIVGIYEELV